MLSSEQIEALESLPEAGRCRQCDGWLDDAHSIPCGHDFCGACIKEALAEENVCPECNLPTWSNAPLRNYQLNNCVGAARKLMEIGNKLQKIEHPAGSYNELVTAGQENGEQEDATLEDVENMFKMCSDNGRTDNENKEESNNETPETTGDTTVMQHGSPWDMPMLASAGSNSSSGTTVLQSHGTTHEPDENENAKRGTSDAAVTRSESATLAHHAVESNSHSTSGTCRHNDSVVIQRDNAWDGDTAMHGSNVYESEKSSQLRRGSPETSAKGQQQASTSIQKRTHKNYTGMTFTIVGTGLNDEEQQKLQRLKEMLNTEQELQYSVTVSKEFLPHITTHVVTKLEDCSAQSRRCLRTVKYLLGVATGAWIVSMEWVNQCLETGCKLDERMFEISEDTCAKHGAISSRKSAQEGGNPLFNDHTFYIHGKLGPLPLKDAQNIIEAAGGRTIKSHTALRAQCSIPSTEKGRIVIVVAHAGSLSGKSRSKLRETADAPVVDMSWVLECISYFQIRPLGPHLIQL
eukprot:gb/GECG01009692.1/.p1 GENE.gb/GECG01009692.1/~~gb/GECG01009692.1/.p1  ORF type:complete len:520 (+),score=80.27 gb/GECG01009692.1/:1-1560(+)